jgi:hypothetical protein
LQMEGRGIDDIDRQSINRAPVFEG